MSMPFATPAARSVVTDRATSRAVVGAIAAVVLLGAIFGFFYAWVCSTMWGLDATDPRVAMQAMQAMNGSVRNAVFAPAFFGSPVVAAVAALLAHRAGARAAAGLLLAAAVLYAVGGLVLTMTINVPMNETLGATAVPASVAEAQRIWDDYSGTWQLWNITRTVVSGLALTLAALGLSRLRRGPVAG